MVVIGDSSVGKTSLIQMFEHNKFSQSFKPTIGADFSNKEIIFEDRVVTLQIWDTAGQERFQSLGSSFYRGADCCVLVYDITNPVSFQNVSNWKSVFLTKSDPKEPETLPFLLLGNKLDMEKTDRKVSTQEVKSFCEENNMLFYETSAKDNLNIEVAFRELIQNLIKRQERLNKAMGGDNDQGKRDSRIVANNMSKRMNRSTKTRLEYNAVGGTKKKSKCCEGGSN